MNSSILKRVVMNFRVFSVVLCVVLLLPVCSQADTGSSDGLTSKNGVSIPSEPAAAHAAPPTSFYAKAGGGVYVLDLQESTPFIHTDSNEDVIGFLDHYDASHQAGPLVDVTVGGEYKAFGRRLFSEASGFLTFHDTTNVNEYQQTSEQWNVLEAEFPGIDGVDDLKLTVEELKALDPVEREERRGLLFGDPVKRDALIQQINNMPELQLAGWVGAIDGTPLDGTPNFAWGDPLRITTNRDVAFWGGDFVTGVSFDLEEQHKLFLFIGPGFKRLSQEFDVFAYEANREPDVNYMTLKEDLEASYYGGTSGIRFDASFTEHWNFLLDGTVGIYYLDSEYEGRQRSYLASNYLASGNPDDLIDVNAHVNVRDSKITTSARLKLSLRARYLERVTFQLGTGIEYLADVPVMRYADVGESFAGGVPHRPARMDYARAFGFLSTFSLGYEF